MSSKRLLLNAMLIVYGVCFAVAQSGGPYAIKDATVEGSAHTSSGGVFVSEVRLGQGLAGQSISGGNFSVGGGFFPAAPPPILTAPTAPVDLAGVATSATRVDLSWTDTSANEEGFKIERCTVSGKRCRDFIVIATTAPDVVAYADVTVMKNTSYQYQLRAFNAVGESPLSNAITVKTPRK